MARLLFEGQDLRLARDTGIAAYTRNLVSAARDLGHEPSLVFESPAPLSRRGPDRLREVELADARFRHTWISRTARDLRRFPGAPFGIRPVAAPRTDAVVSDRAEGADPFARRYASFDLFPRASRTLALYGRLASLRLDAPPDLFHASRPVPLRVPGRPNVYTLHDIVPLRMPGATLDRKKHYHDLLKEVLRTADHLVTVSEFTKSDVCAFFGLDPRRVTTTYQPVDVPAGIAGRSDEALRAELETVFGLRPDEYFLSVGTIEPKKNIGRLVDAFAASRTRRPLVHVGAAGWLCDDVLAALGSERFLSYRLEAGRAVPERRVRRLDYVSRARLATLIWGARALLFPSLYEGFGLPVVEAMTLGTPVVTSSTTSLPEVAGGAAVLVDPRDVDTLTEAIDRVDADADLRADLKARGLARAAFFSPERCRERLASVYATVLG